MEFAGWTERVEMNVEFTEILPEGSGVDDEKEGDKDRTLGRAKND